MAETSTRTGRDEKSNRRTNVSPGPFPGAIRAQLVNMTYVVFVLIGAQRYISNPNDLDLPTLESLTWLEFFFISQFSGPTLAVSVRSTQKNDVI